MCFECVKLSRRNFLSLSAAGAVAAGMLGVSGMTSPSFAATSVTPDEALAKLKAGNEKYVSAPQLCEADLLSTRSTVAKGQQPWATILSCIDSRTAPELIFGGTSLGDLFVARNGAGMADPATIGAIEYGVEHLGSPLIAVIGHKRCGAVSAACDVVEKHTKLPGSIKTMVDAIIPAAQAVKGQPGDFVDNAVRENAKRTAGLILKHSKIVEEAVHAGKVKVVAGYYDLDTGMVEFFA